MIAFRQHGFHSWPGMTALQEMDEAHAAMLVRQLEDLALGAQV